MDKITELKLKRFQFLHHLYEETEGDLFQMVNEAELADKLGLTQEETNRIVDYLREEGLLKIPTFGGNVSITHFGRVQIENALSEPQKPTAYFPSVDSINLHSPRKQTIFISYSRKDEKEKDKLLSHLGVLQKANLISVWSDEEIGPGVNWKQEIEQAMAQATVAILLVTSDFLNSDFILNNEVPKLLKHQHDERLIVFPIIAKACAWKAVSWLREINVYPRNAKPIWSDEGSHVDEDLAAIANELLAIVNRTSPKSTSSSDHGKPPRAKNHPIVVTSKILDVDYMVTIGRDGRRVLVPASGHIVRLTVEATDSRTAIIQDLRPIVLSRSEATGSLSLHFGIVTPRPFEVLLDEIPPRLKPIDPKGTDFPFKVGPGDPEVFDLKVLTSTGDVKWRLELSWTSLGQEGTLRVDLGGSPFRTMARPKKQSDS